MMNTQAANDPQTAKSLVFKRQSQLKEIWRRFCKNRLALAGLAVTLFIILLAVFAEQIKPYELAITMNLREKLNPPSAAHIFGTDGYGRDLFARCIHGARISLFIGFFTSFLSATVGATLGAMAGYYSDKIDNVIMRIMDVFSAIPTILLALSIIAALGSSIPNLIIALTVSRIPGFVRIVRSSVLSIAAQEYVEAARAGGSRDIHILLKHILPNAMGPLIVQATMGVSLMICRLPP
jgi:peptide/nickel transport system permease protein